MDNALSGSSTMPPLMRELQVLEKTQGETLTLLATLADRLQPVMRPATPRPGCGEADKRAEPSAVVLTIMERTEAARSQNERLDDILQRLDV